MIAQISAQKSSLSSPYERAKVNPQYHQAQKHLQGRDNLWNDSQEG